MTVAEASYRSSQWPTGGWSYSWGQDNWQDSMVCSGLVGLAAGKGAQPGEAGKDKVVGDLAKDPQIEKALKFLGRRLSQLGLPLLGEQRRRVEDEAKDLRDKIGQAA